MAGGYGNGHHATALHARDLPAALIVDRHAAHVAAHHDAAVVHRHFGRSRAYLANAAALPCLPVTRTASISIVLPYLPTKRKAICMDLPANCSKDSSVK